MSKKIKVQEVEIALIDHHGEDYISLTDIGKGKEGEDHIKNWLRNRNTVEYLGLWEHLHNPDFNMVEFDHFRKEAGLNSFTLSAKKWVESTGAIGLISKAGRYGGTYAHKDIAFEFATWISPKFKLYLIKEFQRLKELESNEYSLEWNVKRLLAGANYRLQTDAVKDFIIPQSNLSEDNQWIEYATEADILNVAIWGFTAKQWKEANPSLTLSGKNLRDVASINENSVLSTLEAFNAEMIREGITRKERFKKLKEIAQRQLEALKDFDLLKSLKKEDLQKAIEEKNSFGDAMKKISKAPKPKD